MQFIWIFSLVAGVIIIFLFTSFAFKYRELQERKTDFEIVNNLNNAFQKLGNEEISVNLNFVKETGIKCGIIQIKDSSDSHKTDKIIFNKENLKDNSIVWQSSFNYPFKIASFYYVVDKDAKFNLQDENLLEKIPDSLKNNFNSLEGRKIFFTRTGYMKRKDNYYVDTENKIVYTLGNGQWNIPQLQVFLQTILPEKKSINDFEVTHDFPGIGMKTMLLNAMQLDTTQQILLAIEDITVKKVVEKKLADYTKDLEKGVAKKTEELKARINELSEMNRMMVGRELKMKELEWKINQENSILRQA